MLLAQRARNSSETAVDLRIRQLDLALRLASTLGAAIPIVVALRRSHSTELFRGHTVCTLGTPGRHRW